MSKSMNAVAFCALSLATAFAVAADKSAIQEMEPVNVVTVTTPRYQVGADEFLYLGGTYALDNGAVLKFGKSSNRFFASVAGRPDTEVFALNANRFASRDKSIQMTFTPHDSGLSTHVTVQYTHNSVAASDAQATPAQYIVASN
ncbi:MAG: hypothetical protein RL748_4077 [Pseudomonadota bacterium]|jgi:hypothetical protein